MDTMTAFMMGQITRDNKLKVFDWDKAARLIVKYNLTDADAGLKEDWTYTGGNILTDGNLNINSYTYLASTWATPILWTDDAIYDCWLWEDETNWDSDTKWPQSAIEILKRR